MLLVPRDLRETHACCRYFSKASYEMSLAKETQWLRAEDDLLSSELAGRLKQHTQLT